jgi:hypothetical protein
MKVQFELTIGENKFTLIEDVENNADFFKKMSFYSSLPKVGPNGETDLVLQHRVAQKQYDYYSIVSKKADQEYKFGQSKETKGALFAKGWEPLFRSEAGEESSEDAPSHTGIQPPQASAPRAAAPSTGFKAPTPAAPPAQAAPTPAPTVSPQVQSQATNVLSKFGLR